MESLRYGKIIYASMANIADEKKARNLDSVSVARCYCSILRETVFQENLENIFATFLMSTKNCTTRCPGGKGRVEDAFCRHCK